MLVPSLLMCVRGFTETAWCRCCRTMLTFVVKWCNSFFLGPDTLVPLLVVAACRRATCGGGIFQFQGCFSVTVTSQEWACSSIEAP